MPAFIGMVGAARSRIRKPVGCGVLRTWLARTGTELALLPSNSQIAPSDPARFLQTSASRSIKSQQQQPKLLSWPPSDPGQTDLPFRRLLSKNGPNLVAALRIGARQRGPALVGRPQDAMALGLHSIRRPAGPFQDRNRRPTSDRTREAVTDARVSSFTTNS